MNCDDFVPLMLRRVEGRLDEAARAALERHLAGCAACREAAAAQAPVSETLASRPEAPVPASFADGVMERVRAEAGWFGVADWRWLSVRLTPIAALLLIIAGVVIERDIQPRPSPSLSSVVETWANTTSDRQATPVTSVLWEPGANEDAAVLTVLTAPPDAMIARQTDER